MTYNFYERVKKATQEIIDSGAKCSDTVLYWNKRVKELSDPNFKCKDELGNTFSNIVMYVTVKRTVGLYVGQKLTGEQQLPETYSNISLGTHLSDGKLATRPVARYIISIIATLVLVLIMILLVMHQLPT